MIAREWLERGANAQSPFEAFTNFWIAFNNLYGPDGAREIDRIVGFLSDNTTTTQASKVIQDHPDQIAYLLSEPVIDMRGNGRDTAEAIVAFHGTADPLEQLRQLFRVIYQVRCNLLHGQKSPTVVRDEHLCNCSAPIVAAVAANSVYQFIQADVASRPGLSQALGVSTYDHENP